MMNKDKSKKNFGANLLILTIFALHSNKLKVDKSTQHCFFFSHHHHKLKRIGYIYQTELQGYFSHPLFSNEIQHLTVCVSDNVCFFLSASVVCANTTIYS